MDSPNTQTYSEHRTEPGKDNARFTDWNAEWHVLCTENALKRMVAIPEYFYKTKQTQNCKENDRAWLSIQGKDWIYF